MSAVIDSIQVEGIMKKRRRVQDLDVDSYLRVKSNILSILSMIKQNRLDEISSEQLQKLHDEFEFYKERTIINLNLDSVKYSVLKNEFDGYDAKFRKKLLKYLTNTGIEYEELKKRIDIAKDLLQKRQKINVTVQKYLGETKIIKLSKKEIDQLFGDDIDTKVIIRTGKLTKENKDDHSLDEYEFTFSRSSAFQMTCRELEKNIDIKIKECENIRLRVEENKNKWQLVSKKLVHILQAIDNSIVEI